MYYKYPDGHHLSVELEPDPDNYKLPRCSPPTIKLGFSPIHLLPPPVWAEIPFNIDTCWIVSCPILNFLPMIVHWRRLSHLFLLSRRQCLL